MAVSRPGVAYHLTAIVAVRPSHERPLAERLRQLSALEVSPFAQLPATHYVRLAPFNHLGATRPGERVERLEETYLLISLIFDGDPDRYLLSLARLCRVQCEEIFGCCDGWPGPTDLIAFCAWLRSHECDALHSFSTLPAATAAHIRGALSFRQRLIRFAVAAQDKQGAELHRSYLAELAQP